MQTNPIPRVNLGGLGADSLQSLQRGRELQISLITWSATPLPMHLGGVGHTIDRTLRCIIKSRLSAVTEEKRVQGCVLLNIKGCGLIDSKIDCFVSEHQYTEYVRLVGLRGCC